MSKSFSKEEFKQWIYRYLDSDLSDLELEQFNQQLLASASSRQMLIELSGDELNWHKALEGDIAFKSRNKWLSFDMLALYAAAVIFLSIPSIWVYTLITRPDALEYSIEKVSDTVAGSMFETEHLYSGKVYDLKEGQARLVFTDGTKIDLVAPVRWSCLPKYDGTQFYIHEGEIQSVIQKQLSEQPFVFQSDHMKNQIIGTEIMMKVNKAYSELEVIEGIVRSKTFSEEELVQEIKAGQRMIMDKIGEWSRLLKASRLRPLASFNDRPLRDYVFKVSSQNPKLVIDVVQGEQEELIDISVENNLEDKAGTECSAFIKPDQMPKNLKGVRFWVKGKGTQSKYEFRVHDEARYLSTQLSDDISDWKVIELDWDEFEQNADTAGHLPFDSAEMEYLSFKFLDSIELSIKYFEFLR